MLLYTDQMVLRLQQLVPVFVLVLNNKILINWFHTTREAFYTYPCAYTTTAAPVVSNNHSYDSAGIFGTYDGTLTGVNVKEKVGSGQHYNEAGVVICIGY